MIQKHVIATQQLGQMSNEELEASRKRAINWANKAALELRRRRKRKEREAAGEVRMRQPA